jgi:hypothetical protein
MDAQAISAHKFTSLARAIRVTITATRELCNSVFLCTAAAITGIELDAIARIPILTNNEPATNSAVDVRFIAGFRVVGSNVAPAAGIRVDVDLQCLCNSSCEIAAKRDTRLLLKCIFDIVFVDNLWFGIAGLDHEAGIGARLF